MMTLFIIGLYYQSIVFYYFTIYKILIGILGRDPFINIIPLNDVTGDITGD